MLLEICILINLNIWNNRCLFFGLPNLHSFFYHHLDDAHHLGGILHLDDDLHLFSNHKQSLLQIKKQSLNFKQIFKSKRFYRLISNLRNIKICCNIQAQSLFSVSKFSIFGKLNTSLVSDPPMPPPPALRLLSLGPLRLLIINFSSRKTR